MLDRKPALRGGSAGFGTEITALTALIALLDRERSALTSVAVDDLRDIGDAKRRALLQLDALRQIRPQTLAPAERASWEEVQTLVATAKRLNDVNTRLLNSQRALCEARIQALRSRAALDRVYNADGGSAPIAA